MTIIQQIEQSMRREQVWRGKCPFQNDNEPFCTPHSFMLHSLQWLYDTEVMRNKLIHHKFIHHASSNDITSVC